MNAEVTTTVSGYRRLLPTIGSVSVFDPDRDNIQRQPDFFLTPELSFGSFDTVNTSIGYLTGSYKRNMPIAPLTGSRDFDADEVYLTSLIDPQRRFIAELDKKKTQVQEMYHAYMLRIELLRSEAELDGFTVNEASEEDFWLFVRSASFVHKAEVVLVDNGNLRAVWSGEDGSHLGLQFLGNRLVEYVMFKRHQATRDVSREAGRDRLDDIKRQIQAFDLTELVYA